MLSASNILDDFIDLKKINRYVNETDYEKEYNRANIEKNDVLLTIVGTIGRTAVVTTDEKFCIQRSICLIKHFINPQYLAYCLRSSEIKKIIDSKAKGTAQRGIYLNNVVIIPIPLPPLKEQSRIVKKLNDIITFIQDIQNLINL